MIIAIYKKKTINERRYFQDGGGGGGLDSGIGSSPEKSPRTSKTDKIGELMFNIELWEQQTVESWIEEEQKKRFDLT